MATPEQYVSPLLHALSRPLVGGAALHADDVLPDVERELRFIVARKKLPASLERLPQQLIRQHFFSGKIKQLLAALALYQRGVAEPALRITQTRLRHIVHEADERFLLEAKGRLPQHDRTERVEVSAPIEPQLYSELLGYAQGGSIEKVRYSLRGTVSPTRRGRLPVRAEIDVIHALGTSELPSELRGFALVDVELSSMREVDAFRRGRHSFSFLRDALELSAAEKEVRKALSTQRLARKGLDSDARRIVASVLR